MVVVDPNDITRSPFLSDLLSESFVGSVVSVPRVVLPCSTIRRNILPKKIVEQRPKSWDERKGGQVVRD